MKIVQINVTCGAGSTGKICSAVAELLDQHNVENYIFYSSGKSLDSHGKKYLSERSTKLQALRSRVLGNYGFNTVLATKKLLKELDKISPDIVHLHNLHGHNVNLTMLFRYFKRYPEIKIFWTFHDCWAFTGYCTHFTFEKCDKWITGCQNCIQSKRYSWFFDRSSTIYRRKKELIDGLDITVITPSKWLGELVKKSFFKAYPIKVINNGINLSVFKPTDSDFRTKYACEDKYILLGVAFGWGVKKGLDVFLELSKRLPDNYQIVLVGTDDSVDAQLPENIISIHRTHNQEELAEIYSVADVFVNPTREETQGLTTIEAFACGTPAVVFRAGGATECIKDDCGVAVDVNDIDAMEREIIRICESKPYSKEACIERAREFDMAKRFDEYVGLYRKGADE